MNKSPTAPERANKTSPNGMWSVFSRRVKAIRSATLIAIGALTTSVAGGGGAETPTATQGAVPIVLASNSHTGNNGEVKQASSKVLFDVSNLSGSYSEENVKTLLEEARNLNIEVKGKIDSKDKFEALIKQIKQEEKRLDWLVNFVKGDEEVMDYLRKSLKVDKLNLPEVAKYLRRIEVQSGEQIVDGASIAIAEIGAEGAIVQQRQEEYAKEGRRAEQELRGILNNLPNVQQKDQNGNLVVSN